MFRIRSVGMVVIAGLVLGCQAKQQAPAEPPPASAQTARAARAHFMAANPNALVGVVNAVYPPARLASVGDLPPQDLHVGDVVSILDEQQNPLVEGTIVRNDTKYLQVRYMDSSGHREPRAGDLAVHIRNRSLPMADVGAPIGGGDSAPRMTHREMAPATGPANSSDAIMEPASGPPPAAPAVDATQPPATEPAPAPETKPDAKPDAGTDPATSAPPDSGAAPAATDKPADSGAGSDPGKGTAGDAGADKPADKAADQNK